MGVPSENHSVSRFKDRAPFSATREEVLATLEGTPAGLTRAGAAARLAREGENKLREPPTRGFLRRLLAQFTDVTVLALLGAAGVAVAIGLAEDGASPWLERFGDALAIGFIVVLNAGIGFIQESRAESALRALGQLTAPTALVLRDGATVEVPASSLVSGDVVLLAEGSRVPADLRLLETVELAVNESTLTGESVVVSKVAEDGLPPDTPLAERRNMAYSGTHVTGGRGKGLVVATGMNTELGQIADLMSSVELPETPLQRDLRAFGVRLVVGCVLIGVAVFGVGIARGQADLAVLFMIAVSVAVAAIPEGLPAVTTIVLAMGVQRMARRHALVRRLSAVETLGAAQVIATDKTGTLTQNRMAVRRLAGPVGSELEVPPEGDLFEDAKRIAADASSPFSKLFRAVRYAPSAKLTDADGRPEVFGDPTDGAFLLLARSLELPEPDPVVTETPFDAARRFATVVVQEGEQEVAYHHGAPEAIFGSARHYLDDAGEVRDLDPSTVTAMHDRIERWGDLGLRVLALSTGPEDSATVIGLVGVNDPPRPEVRAAVQLARAAGIRSVVITGDHPRTARAIAKEVGLPAREIAVGAEVDEWSDETLFARAPRIDVVARATAAHKMRFVQALQKHGLVVAMTGDGVNDAPALRAATIGVAMGRGGTDVAREAADIVLSDDNYATIVAAVEEGRIIYSNIRKFILFLLSINAGLVLAVLVAALAGWPPLLTPTQILWINLVTNGVPALALGMEPIHLDHMSRPPRDTRKGLLDFPDAAWILAHGAWMAGLSLVLFAVLRDDSLERARTAAFVFLAIAPVFHAFSCRSTTRSVFELGWKTNPVLWMGAAAAFVLQSIAVYVPGLSGVFHTVPIGAGDLGVVFGLCMVVLLAGELEKVVRAALTHGVSDARA
jgi:Ca2+-transporting ATPase